jgi:Na+/proline symporter
MIDSGALLTQGFYRTRFAPGKSDRHYLWVGRISGLSVVLLSIVYALFLVQRVLYSFLLTETLATYIGISVVVGLVWRRANRWGAAASMAAALIVNFVLYHLHGSRLDYWDPKVFLASLAAGTVTLVIVSLATTPEPQTSISSFFNRLAIPSDGGWQGNPLDNGVDPSNTELTFVQRQESARNGRQLIMTNALHLRRGACGIGLWKAYHDDLKGLLIGVALTASLVLGLWMLLQL